MRLIFNVFACSVALAAASPTLAANGLPCIDQGLTDPIATDLSAAFHADQDPPAAFMNLVRQCAVEYRWSPLAANSAYLYALMRSEERIQRATLPLSASEIEQIDALARSLDMGTVRELSQEQPSSDVQRAFDARVVALRLRSGAGRQEAFVQRVGTIFAERRAADDFARQ